MSGLSRVFFPAVFAVMAAAPVSYGAERPVCAEHNEECWAKNRRGLVKAEGANRT